MHLASIVNKGEQKETLMDKKVQQCTPQIKTIIRDSLENSTKPLKRSSSINQTINDCDHVVTVTDGPSEFIRIEKSDSDSVLVSKSYSTTKNHPDNKSKTIGSVILVSESHYEKLVKQLLKQEN